MESQLNRLFLQYRNNPALWVDDDHREALIAGGLPGKLLEKSWRQHHLSPLLASKLALGDAGTLQAKDLTSQPARAMLLAKDDLHALATCVGICFLANAFRVLIDRQSIDKATRELGGLAVGLARNGTAKRCLDEAEAASEGFVAPRHAYPGTDPDRVVALGCVVIASAGHDLAEAWRQRLAYKLPRRIGDIWGDMERLPADFCAKLLKSMAAELTNLPAWLQ